MKRFVIFIFLPLIICLVYFSQSRFENLNISHADTAYSEISEDDINQAINEQLENIDFSDVEKIIDSLSENEQAIFGNNSFSDKVLMLLSGDLSGDFPSIWSLLASLFFDNILSLLPLIATIIAISILGGIVGNLNTPTNNKSMTNIVHFVIYSIIVIMLSTIILKMVSLTSNTISSIKGQIDVVFPILLTTLTALGGTTSVGAYQPAIAMFSGLILEVFTSFILPLFLVSIILNLVSNLSTSVKLNKLISFINSLFKWVIGIVFTVFTGFVAIQGIAAGAVDGLSIKTAKFTLKNSLPIVGGYLSDGLFLILASTNLVKNTVGGAGLLLLLATVLSPIIELVLFMLALKLMAGIIEPLGDGKVANFISTLSKSMNMLIVMIASVSFIYIIMTGLVICSANII